LPRTRYEFWRLILPKLKFDEWTDEVTRLDQQHSNLGDVQDLHEKRKEIQVKINSNKETIRGFQVRFLAKFLHEYDSPSSKADMKRIDQEIATGKKSIANLDRQIEEEARRMETHTNEKREKARAKLDQAKSDWEAKDAELKKLEAEMRTSDEESQKAENEGRGLDDEVRQAEGEVANCRQQIVNCDNQAKSSFAPYGNNIPEIIEQTKKMKWHGNLPVGPLGVYVKLKDPKWATTMRLQLGNLMTSWAVTDARDRQPLKQLLDKGGKLV
jgi:chromosome segregation ATPase